MFKNVGNELKMWAKVIVILSTLPWVGLGVFLWTTLANNDAGFWGFLVFACLSVVGYFIARFTGILTYAYGELVETVVDIDTGIDMLLKSNENKQN